MKPIFLIFVLLGAVFPALAGPGHDHGESAFAVAEGPAENIVLTDQQITNLKIKSSKVQFLPITQTVSMLAFTELLPERRASVSTHFEGTVLSIEAKIGEEVKKGQLLAKAKPINVGAKVVAFYSPIDGFVLELNAELGEILPTGGNIMHVGDSTQMLVRGVAYETPEITTIKIGQKVEVHLDINPDRHVEGKIQRINRIIDSESRTFSLYALINTPEGDIQPGLQGVMEIFTGNDTPVLTVPKRAVLGEMGSQFVYVIKGKEVEKREVLIGTRTGHHIEVKKGLFPHERVVTNGNYQLQYISIGGIHEHDDHNHDHDDHNHDHDDHNHDHDDHNHDHDDHNHDHDDHNHDHDDHNHDHDDHNHEHDDHNHDHDDHNHDH